MGGFFITSNFFFCACIHDFDQELLGDKGGFRIENQMK